MIIKKQSVERDAETIYRAKILDFVITGKVTQIQAARELGLKSDRQVRNLLFKYIQGGQTIKSLKRARQGVPWNKLSSVIRDKVKEIKKRNTNFTNPHIAEIAKRELKDQHNLTIKFNRSTVRNILLETPDYKPAVIRFRPAKRFEMKNIGELLQMDTTSSRRWFYYFGGKLICCVAVLDDHSRKILSAHLFFHDDVYSNMLVLREVIEQYGVFETLYVDNDSKFKFNEQNVYRKQRIRIWLQKQSEIITRIKLALIKLDIVLINHRPGNPRGKGKIEKWNQFLQSWFCQEHQFDQCSLEQLDDEFQAWIKWYNNRKHEGINKQTPNQRWNKAIEEKRVKLRILPKNINLDDIFCMTEEKALRKDNTFMYQGKFYDLYKNRRSITRKARVVLHVHPRKKIRVFYKGEFVQEIKLQVKN